MTNSNSIKHQFFHQTRNQFRALLVLFLLFGFTAKTDAQNKNANSQGELTNNELLLIYGKASDAIETYISRLNAFLDDDISEEFAQYNTQQILALFTSDKANIFSDLNATNIDYSTSPTSAVDISSYIVQYRAQSGIIEVIYSRDALGFEMTPVSFNGQHYILRVGFNKLFQGSDRNGKPYTPARRLATFFVDKSGDGFNALIQEISFLNPNTAYGFLPESASKAIVDAAIAQMEMKRTGNDSLHKQINVNALNAALESVVSQVNQSKDLYDSYIHNARKFLNIKDFNNASIELERAGVIQSMGGEYLSLKHDLNTQKEQEARRLLKWTEESLRRMEYERAEYLTKKMQAIGIDENLLSPLIKQSADGVKRWNQLINRKANNQDFETAINNLNRIIASNQFQVYPDSLAEVYTALAYLTLKKNEKNASTNAANFLKTAIELKENLTRAHLLTLEIDQSTEKAIQVYSKLISKDDENEEWFLLRANAYETSGDTKKSIKDLEQILSINSQNITARKKLALLLLSQEDYSAAVKNYRILQNVNPDATHSVFITFALLEMNNLDSAIIEKNKYAAIGSYHSLDSLAQVYIAAAEKQMRFSALEEAAALYEKLHILVGHQGDYAQQWVQAADCYYYMNRHSQKFERSLAFLQYAINERPKYFEALFKTGQIFLEMKNYSEAKQTFTECLSVRKNDFETTRALGQTFYEEGKYFNEAKHHFENALQIGETNKVSKTQIYDVRIQLARCERSMDKLDEAITHTDEALKINSTKPDAHFEQGVTLGLKKEEALIKKGLKLVDKALELGYNQADCLKAKANILLRLGNYALSLEELNKLDRNAKLSPQDYITRAKAHEGLGSLDEALLDLTEASHIDKSLLLNEKFLTHFSIVRLKKAVKSNVKSDIEGAITLLDSAQRQHSEEATIYLALSASHWYLGNTEEAIQQLRTALKFDLNVSVAENDPFFKDYFKIKEIKQTLKEK